MPRCRTDVLELLAATVEMADLHPETPPPKPPRPPLRPTAAATTIIGIT
jgi:hypothetical protein